MNSFNENNHFTENEETYQYKKINSDKNLINEENEFINIETKKENEIIYNNLPLSHKKKLGRKKKKLIENQNETSKHDRYSEDNIKRKIKSHYHNFIVAFLNMKFKNILNKNYKFGKISSKITRNINVEYNLQLFQKPIKDIITNISDKYQDKEKNKISLQILMQNVENKEEINQLLNTNYKDMYLIYYL